MSRKNRKNRTINTVTATDRHLHAVTEGTDQPDAPTTEDKVRTALTERPGSTTAELAMAAGVGRSTAAKVLARWDRDGTALRTEGQGPRHPDTWTLATPEGDTPTETDATQSDAVTTPGVEHVADADDAVDTDDADVAEDAAADDVVTHIDDDDSSTEETTVAEPQGTNSDDDADGIEGDAPASAFDAEIVAAETVSGDATPQDAAAATDVTDNGVRAEPEASAPIQAPADTAPTIQKRLAKGGLRGLVEDYLAEHPGDSFGPAKIGKDLCRSGGAVNNALEKLVADGYAIKTCEAPKRFAIKPDKADVAE